MARKWIEFFRSMESLLRDIGLKVINRTFWQKRYLYLLSLLFVGVLLAIAIPTFSQTSPPAPTSQTSDNVEQQVGTARQAYQEGRYLDAIQTLQTVIELLAPVDQPQLADQPRLATTLTNLGLAQLALGRAEDALDSWQRSETIYKLLGNNNGEARSLIYQAQAFQELGAYVRSCEASLDALIKLGELKTQIQSCDDLTELMLYAEINTENLPDDSGSPQLGITKITSWYQVGDALRTIGKLDESEWILRNLSIPIRKEEVDEEVPAPFNYLNSLTKASIHLSLGNTRRAIATLKRDRQDISTKQDIVPWRCEDSAVLSAPSTPYLSLTDILNTYDQAISSYEYVIKTLDTINTSDNLANQKLIRVQAQINYLSLITEAKLVAAYKEQPSQKQPAVQSGRTPDTQAQLEYGQALDRLAQYDRIVLALEGINANNEDRIVLNLLPEIQASLAALPENRAAVYAYINFAKSLSCLEHKGINTNISPLEQLEKANQIVLAIKQTAPDSPRIALSNSRSESYALGSFGSFYEYKEDLEKASQFTEEALLVSQAIEAPDITYQWQWQSGRILIKQENIDEATQAFKRTVQTLESVRGSLFTISSDIQFSFRDNVEPLYRNYIDLLLHQKGNSTEVSKDALEEAVKQFSSLQLAELQNFFQCDLSQFRNEKQSSNVFQNTIVIYSIILRDRLEIIFRLPDQSLAHYPSLIDYTELENAVKEMRSAILEVNKAKALPWSKKIYKWLIVPPLKEFLDGDNQVETLVFVLDGYLRNIPIAALTNEVGRYLVQEKYALSVLPSTKLFELETPLQELTILAAGIDIRTRVEVEGQWFSPIDTKKEVERIKGAIENTILEESLTELLNEQFTKENLQQNIDSRAFSIVHLITHGNFSSDPNNTYVLAFKKANISIVRSQQGLRVEDNLFDQEHTILGSDLEFIRAKDFNNLLRISNRDTPNNIALFILSACKTAEGDNRAILGLAGIAVQAGASSALATLWQVQNDSTIKLVEEFYRNLANKFTRSEALHLAQKKLLEDPNYENPYYWSPYTLIGNWR